MDGKNFKIYLVKFASKKIKNNKQALFIFFT